MSVTERAFVEHAAYLWFRPASLTDAMRQACNLSRAVELVNTIAFIPGETFVYRRALAMFPFDRMRPLADPYLLPHGADFFS